MSWSFHTAESDPDYVFLFINKLKSWKPCLCPLEGILFLNPKLEQNGLKLSTESSVLRALFSHCQLQKHRLIQHLEYMYSVPSHSLICAVVHRDLWDTQSGRFRNFLCKSELQLISGSFSRSFFSELEQDTGRFLTFINLQVRGQREIPLSTPITEGFLPLCSPRLCIICMETLDSRYQTRYFHMVIKTAESIYHSHVWLSKGYQDQSQCRLGIATEKKDFFI